MNIIKQWTFCVCSTVILSVILSMLSPSGSSGRMYKTVISVFIFASFLYPFSNFDLSDAKFDFKNVPAVVVDNTNSIANSVVEREIKRVLSERGIDNARVLCSSQANADNEIVLDDVTVTVGDDYDCEEIKQVVYDELSLNVRVIHIGE